MLRERRRCMNIEYLFYLTDIAKTKSISASASNCFMTQQGLSRIVRVMEEEFGVKLIMKSGAGIALTPAGEELVKYAEAIKEFYSIAIASVSSYGTDTSALRPFVINMTVLSSFVLHHAVGHIQNKYRNVLFHERSHNEIFRMLRDQPDWNNQLFFVSIPRGSDFLGTLSEMGVAFRKMYECYPMALVGRNSPYANKKVITARELSELPLAYYKDDVMQNVTMKMLLKNERPKELSLYTTNLALIRETVRNGSAISFCTSKFACNVEDVLVPIPLEKTVTIDFGVVQPVTEEISPFASNLADLLEKLLSSVNYLEF